MASTSADGILPSKMSPSYLRANSTTHTWVFSAIAELIDNAYDPDANARILTINKRDITNSRGQHACLTFSDNGAGMDGEKLYKMLSFGFCEKMDARYCKSVGKYGNGFKSGSMRLGEDAIVFTKHKNTMSVGLLSQTYLQEINAETVLVPMVTWNRQTNQMVDSKSNEDSLRTIVKHSLFPTENELLDEFDNLDGVDTGTLIIIYNLKKNGTGILELDFESNKKDIINSEQYQADGVYRLVQEYTPAYRRSLREYCSILFLKPHMKIILRGEQVKTKLVYNSLTQTAVSLYKPRFLNRSIRIHMGFGSRKEDSGVMLYHNNRLIKAFEKVGYQKQEGGQGQGKGVVGVVEVDFLEPIHNKTDFLKTDQFNVCMSAFGQKLNEYWNLKTDQPDSESKEADRKETDNGNWIWAMCDNCNKWRRILESGNEYLPERWYCYMNRDPVHNRCEVKEEPEEEDDALLQQAAQYSKSLKKQKIAKALRLELNEKNVAPQSKKIPKRKRATEPPSSVPTKKSKQEEATFQMSHFSQDSSDEDADQTIKHEEKQESFTGNCGDVMESASKSGFGKKSLDLSSTLVQHDNHKTYAVQAGFDGQVAASFSTEVRSTILSYTSPSVRDAQSQTDDDNTPEQLRQLRLNVGALLQKLHPSQLPYGSLAYVDEVVTEMVQDYTKYDLPKPPAKSGQKNCLIM